MQDDTRNKEGYKDPTPYKAMMLDKREQTAFYVFQTMISVARLAGFHVEDNIIITDKDGGKYKSLEIMKRRRNV